MARIELGSNIKRARNVLNGVLKLRLPEVVARNTRVKMYRNCRENGFALYVTVPRVETYVIAFSESRSTDSIVIWEGTERDFDPFLGTPKHGANDTYIAAGNKQAVNAVRHIRKTLLNSVK